MSILLTGGTGYIGSHTAVELITAGFNVAILDNLSNSDESVIDRIEEITGKRPLFFKADCTNVEEVERVFNECKEAGHVVEAVIHFAGLKAVGESVQQPFKYYDNNINSTLTLLKVMEKNDCTQLIFSSSATVYGDSANVPFKEDAPTGNCTNPYGYTKFMNEQILKDVAAANRHLSIVLLRYFNPIGAHPSGLLKEQPKGTPNNLMPYIVQVANGTLPVLKVFGNDYKTKDGTGVRDYIHVMDLASGHKAALIYAKMHLGCTAINLGTGQGVSVLEVIKTFEKANKVKIYYEIAPRRDGDVAKSYADPTRARKELGWKTKYTLEDACRDAYKQGCMQTASLSQE